MKGDRPPSSDVPAGATGGLGAHAFAVLAVSAGVLHLTGMALAGCLRTEHVVVDVLVATLPWLGGRALEFVRGAFPAWIFGALYDGQRFLVGLRGPVHTGDLESLELRWFPAPGGTSWPRWWQSHTWAPLDLLTGLGYATYLAEVGVMALVLFALRSPRFRTLTWAFLFAGVLGLVGYLLYPAAPPWYVAAHGPGPANPLVTPSAAGALRFDSLVGVGYFASFYSRNPNAFAAMPSLHAAFPVVVTFAVWDRGWRWRVPAAAYAVLIGFSAIYLDHHWVLDVVAGVAVGLAGSALAWAALRAAGAASASPAVAVAPAPASPEPAERESDA
ncbi:MAG TPA: phosphatase PAP2 family protein [Myxococcales bacterium]|jgi:membrane-associated phospholipid phosphatase